MKTEYEIRQHLLSQKCHLVLRVRFGIDSSDEP